MRVKGLVWSVAVWLSAAPLAAQPVYPSSDSPTPGLVSLGADEPPPAYVAALDGSATLTRAGASTALDLNTPVIEGDRLRVDAGHLELRWDDGTALFVDSRTTIDVVAVDRLRLVDGQARFVAGRGDTPARWVIDTPSAQVTLDRARDVVLVVDGTGAGQSLDAFALQGTVDVANDRGTFSASQGDSVHAEAFRAPTNGRSRVAAGDLMAWSQSRLDEVAQATEAAPVSNGVVEYDDYSSDTSLVRYGTWDRDPEYGAIWYPTASADWRPYYNGRWERLGRYGYVWVGADPWSYRTHHYGRWGHRAGRWFWIPGRTWASAWVSWAVGDGYVSWSPLGYDDRPVFSFSLSYGSSYTRGYRDRYDGWYGWTVVPSDRWRRGGRVDRYAVNPRDLPDRVRGGFVTQSVAPYRGTLSRMGRDSYAVPRSAPRVGDDTREMIRRGVGPTRVERDTPTGYVPATPRRGGDIASSPYERARRYQDRSNVPQGAPPPQGDTPGGAVRRTAPRSEPPADRPSYDERSAPRPRSNDTPGDVPRSFTPGERSTPRSRAYEGAGSAPPAAQPRERSPRGDGRPTPQYDRPEPRASRYGDESGARVRSREREVSRPQERTVAPDAGRRSGGSSEGRSGPRRVPSERRPRG